MSSSQLMDTEPGGEQTAYESIDTVNKPPARQGGTLEDSSEPTEAESQAQDEASEKGERTAEKIRYGQTISEGGMSGFTTGQEGQAEKNSYGRQPAQEDDQSPEQTRQQQGYDGGSGVGG